MYVDDLMKSTSTAEIKFNLARLLEKGGLRLTKWNSNKGEVMTTIPESERAISAVNLELERLAIESVFCLKKKTSLYRRSWRRYCN